jgi:D-3-phosphoglycerate dehydrogenase / 2-oxoglutarate reductase
VWAEEPPTDWRLAKHPRVVAAPHLGASTEEAQLKAAMQACARVCDFLDSGDAGLAINAQVRVPAPLRPWVELAEELAGFALQLVDGTIEEILVASDPALDPEALRVHALVGALRVGSESAVNAINAPAMAAERGWAVASKRLPDANPPYVRLEVRSTQGHVLIEGTHTPHYGGRVTRIDGFDVEFRPRGRFLVTHHDDVPGVLAAITRVLADADVNVAGVSLARERARGDALAVIEVDGSIPKQARDALRMVAHIRVAHRVRVGV